MTVTHDRGAHAADFHPVSDAAGAAARASFAAAETERPKAKAPESECEGQKCLDKMVRSEAAFYPRKIPKRIRATRQKRCWRLPGVKADGQWDIPATGGYGGGCRTGAALAQCLMRRWRHGQPDGFLYATDHNTLLIVLERMFMHGLRLRLGDATPASPMDYYEAQADKTGALTAYRGQVVGFVAAIAQAAVVGSRCYNFSRVLDRPEADMIADANRALAFDEDAWLATLSDDED